MRPSIRFERIEKDAGAYGERRPGRTGNLYARYHKSIAMKKVKGKETISLPFTFFISLEYPYFALRVESFSKKYTKKKPTIINTTASMIC